MYCKSCGREIDTPQGRFCRFCGAKLEEPARGRSRPVGPGVGYGPGYGGAFNPYQGVDPSRMSKRQKLRYKLKASPIPTNWMRFYILWRFPIGFLSGAFNVITTIALLVENIAYVDWPLMIFCFLVDGIEIALMIAAYIQMKRLTLKGFQLNQILLLYNIFSFGIYQGVGHWYDGMFPVSFLAGCLLFGFLFTLPNLIYFKKRRFLFTGIEPIPAPHPFPQNRMDGYAFDPRRELERLEQLKRDGFLSQEEYEERKNDLTKML